MGKAMSARPEEHERTITYTVVVHLDDEFGGLNSAEVMQSDGSQVKSIDVSALSAILSHKAIDLRNAECIANLKVSKIYCIRSKGHVGYWIITSIDKNVVMAVQSNKNGFVAKNAHPIQIHHPHQLTCAKKMNLSLV